MGGVLRLMFVAAVYVVSILIAGCGDGPSSPGVLDDLKPRQDWSCVTTIPPGYTEPVTTCEWYCNDISCEPCTDRPENCEGNTPEIPGGPGSGQCDPAYEICEGGGGGGGSGGDAGGPPESGSCDPQAPGCKLPLEAVDSAKIIEALAATRRTEFTDTIAAKECVKLYQELVSDWAAGNRFYRGNVDMPDREDDQHDAYFDGQDYHIDQDYLRTAPAWFLLELLLHEVGHKLRRGNHGATNGFGGYDEFPFRFTTPGTKIEANSCVIRPLP